MGQQIKGLRRGVTIHTPAGWYRNGTTPTPAVAKALKEMDYTLESTSEPEKELPAVPVLSAIDNRPDVIKEGAISGQVKPSDKG